MYKKAKYLLNAEGKKYRANTLLGIVWKVLTKKDDKLPPRKYRKAKLIKS